jgi:ribosomal protein S18 acetylase RimI-like enzyme
MSVTIRAPRPDNVDEERELLEAALRSDQTFLEEEIAVALELIDSALEPRDHDPEQALDRDYTVLVADLLGFPVAGYICFGRTPMTEATWDLYWVVTHAEARGRGVARALIRAMERELVRRGARAIRVETSQKESHEAARRLYDRLGYPEQARFPDFYRVGDDLIVYYKVLGKRP